MIHHLVCVQEEKNNVCKYQRGKWWTAERRKVFHLVRGVIR